MSRFFDEEKGWVCWAPESPAQIIRVDAPASSAPVFLATHHDRLLREVAIDALSGGETGTVVTQDVFFRRFRDAPAPELMFAVLLGKSGTGKSHVVKWALSELQRRNDPRDHVVYVAKTDMSLRRVIELTIEGLDGPGIDRVRRDLENARDRVHEELAASELAQFLAIAVDRVRVARNAPAEDEHYRTVRDLVGDPTFQESLIALPAFAEYAEQVATGSQKSSTSAFKFSPEQLPGQEQLLDAGRRAQTAAAKLLTREPDRHRLVTTLNECLGIAVRRMVGLGTTNLLQLFTEVRNVLGQTGKRLLILIEDLTVLSGIENDFADAITVPSTDDAPLCELRVLAASTDENYYASPFWTKETVRTRTSASGRAYLLDQLWEDFGDTHLNQFLGRYLNAVRIGIDELERSFDTTVSDTTWVPNACTGCPKEALCSAVFGLTPDGYSLYPFTQDALKRLRNLIGAEFDPRKLLAATRETLLDHREDLLKGQFPPVHLESLFRKNEIRTGEGLHPLEKRQLEQVYGPQAPRYETFYSVWGYGELSRSIDAVAKTFGLDPSRLDEAGILSESESGPPRDEGAVSGPPQSATREAEAMGIAKQVAEWANGRTLSDTIARQIRSIVHSHLLAALESRGVIDTNNSWFDKKRGAYLTLGSIKLTNSEGGGGAVGKWALELDPTNNDAALFVQAILLYNEFGHWHFENGPELQRIYAQRMECWVEDLIEFVRQGSQETNGFGSDLVKLLASAGAIFGALGKPPANERDLIRLTFSSFDDSERRDEWGLAVQSKLLNGLPALPDWTRQRILEEVLKRFGVRQGRGDYRAIDVMEVLTRLEDFPTDHLPLVSERSPNELRRYWSTLSKAVDEALEVDGVLLRGWRHLADKIRSLVGDADLIDLLHSVSDLVVVAEEGGLLGGIRSSSEWTSLVGEAHARSVQLAEIMTELESYAELSFWEKVAFVARDPGPTLELGASIVGFCSRIVRDTKEYLQQQRRAMNQDVGLETYLRSILDRLACALDCLEASNDA